MQCYIGESVYFQAKFAVAHHLKYDFIVENQFKLLLIVKGFFVVLFSGNREKKIAN